MTLSMRVSSGLKVWQRKASDKEIVESHLLKGKTEASFLAYRKETEPEEIGGKLYRLQIRCVTWEDDLYPPLLRTTANPPAHPRDNPVPCGKLPPQRRRPRRVFRNNRAAIINNLLK